jgi:predicted nucleic acid-binding protein
LIAVDTSALSAFLAGASGNDVEFIRDALQSGNLAMPPVVITEILSDPVAGLALDAIVTDIQYLDVTDGYWHRAGANRRILKAKGLKAKIADTLIAQSCIDHDVPLIARDKDFRHFAKHCGLKLA